MCKPISLIITEDKVFLPPEDVWNHSHSVIIETHNIPDILIGDKYLRLEVTPPEENVFRNKETNEKLEVNDTWKVIVDEENIPDWYNNDKPNQEYRVREAAKKWFNNFPDNLLDGYKKIAGDNYKLIAGNYCKLTAGDYSTLTAGDYSRLTAEYGSTLTAGDYSTLIAGYGSELTAKEQSLLIAYENSVFCGGEGSRFILHWHDGIRMRTTTAYVGENEIKPNKKYLGKDGKFTEEKTKTTTKKKASKKNVKKKKTKKRK